MIVIFLVFFVFIKFIKMVRMVMINGKKVNGMKVSGLIWRVVVMKILEIFYGMMVLMVVLMLFRIWVISLWGRWW